MAGALRPSGARPARWSRVRRTTAAARLSRGRPRRVGGRQFLPLFLAETVSPDVRCAIEASSVMRWVVGRPGADSRRRPRRRGFCYAGRHAGLHATLRGSAWSHLRMAAAHAVTPERDRITFDLIFLLEHPAVRQASLESVRSGLSVEPAPWAPAETLPASSNATNPLGPSRLSCRGGSSVQPLFTSPRTSKASLASMS